MKAMINRDVVLPSRIEMLFAWSIVTTAAMDMGCETLVMTSGVEGTHSKKSKHWSGFAMDIYVEKAGHWITELNKAFAATLSDMLPDFDVVFEADPLHVHIEFDPAWVEIEVKKL